MPRPWKRLREAGKCVRIPFEGKEIVGYLRLLGLLGRPMLVIAGAQDIQFPVSDMDLLLHNGDVPKVACINLSGGHLGRERSG